VIREAHELVGVPSEVDVEGGDEHLRLVTGEKVQETDESVLFNYQIDMAD
jgi:hypothetical protein